MNTITNIRQLGTHYRNIRARNGVLMSVCFEVSEIDGVIRGRIISAQPIYELSASGTEKQNSSNKNIVYCLSAAKESLISPYSWITQKKIVSPFSLLDLLTSVKIRATSL